MTETDDKNNTPETNNVIPLPSRAERQRQKRAEEKKSTEPLFNTSPLLKLPPVTKFMLLAFLGVHLITDVVMSPNQQFWAFAHFGFIPAYYSGQLPFSWAALAGPLTFTFLHGGWTHIILNGLMIMAFGAGVEKWMGGKRFLVFFMLCNLFAALAQFVFSPGSTAPVIGASGGLSGLFAAVLIMMQMQGAIGQGSRYGILPFIVLWIVISAIFGMMGAPGGGNVAWAAHIGGFLAGFALLKPIMRARFLD
ncbi:MAG: rhomboid family intramembrane serine protease [Micavibrio aeruginosavorus]|uniref:Rhomboid family intramembrane serine protease n=1 Tax=Micavibrio aeruginosavorus TaxID=349221 RepID=A0A7T5R3F2_9BACT|nr:MAG: rhomboid family intramembrane serine protease [Micavibrio aeruginosavorus]